MTPTQRVLWITNTAREIAAGLIASQTGLWPSDEDDFKRIAATAYRVASHMLDIHDQLLESAVAREQGPRLVKDEPGTEGETDSSVVPGPWDKEDA